eukprot:514387-Amphidinium_carterae.1
MSHLTRVRLSILWLVLKSMQCSRHQFWQALRASLRVPSLAFETKARNPKVISVLSNCANANAQKVQQYDGNDYKYKLTNQ